MNGDLLWHNTLVFGAQTDGRRTGKTLDFEPLLEGVRPVVESADLAICHNEVPIAPPKGGPYSYYPTFSAPEETLDAVKALGYDVCTTGSNHSLDQLRRAQADPRRDGCPRDPAQRHRPQRAGGTDATIFTTAAGVKIGLVEGGAYGTNGIPLPDGKPWAVQASGSTTCCPAPGRPGRPGADIVLVAMHDGEEYQSAPTAEQEALADALTKSPPMSTWSTATTSTSCSRSPGRTESGWPTASAIWSPRTNRTCRAGTRGITPPRFTFTEQEPGKFSVSLAEYFPTLVTYGDGSKPARTYLVDRALADGTGDRARLLAARERTNQVVHSLGHDEGLTEH